MPPCPNSPPTRCCASADETIRCRYLAGCDGHFSVCRGAIPPGVLTVGSGRHEFGWVAMLGEAPPSTDEIIYALGSEGFAGHMLRTSTVSRYYVQCPPGDVIENWSRRPDLVERCRPGWRWTAGR